MDTETILYLVLVVGGLLVVIAIMVFVMNPPEAWVKRAFNRNADTPSPKAQSAKNSDQEPLK